MKARAARLDTQQSKALGWYVTLNDLIPQMSAWPIFRFKKRSDGEYTEENIGKITLLYKQAKKEEAKEKARAKKQEMQEMQNGNGRVYNASKSMR